MTQTYSVLITPLTNTIARYQLNATRFFEAVNNYLKTGSETTYRIELEQLDPVYSAMIAMETVPYIEDLITDIESTDNLKGFFLTDTQLILVGGEKSC